MASRVAEAPARRFWNVPNSLTVVRLGLALVVFWCIGRRYDLAALAVFGLASLTDALDGYFARLLDQASPIGRQLDPLVDKVIVAGSLIYLLPIAGTGLEPWMVAAIVIRELIVQALRSLIEGRGEPFGARWAGKLKALFQCLAIAAILFGLHFKPGWAWLWFRDTLTWSAVFLTIYSGLGYLVLAWKKLKGAV
jgi:CDP-diacylglycerol--glycerol-3-phosphate 3-phosphatidyltransferase